MRQITDFLSAEECQSIVETYTNFVPGTVFHRTDTPPSQEWRKCSVCKIDLDADNTFIHDRIVESIPELGDYFVPHYQLTKYETGDFFRQHVDQFEGNAEVDYERYFTCIIQLTDEADYVGGESITDEGIINNTRGNLAVFESNVKHAVYEVMEGTRYALVIWYCKNI